MRVVSWNANGIRACVRHGFVDFVDRSGTSDIARIGTPSRRMTAWRSERTTADRDTVQRVGSSSNTTTLPTDVS